MLQEIESFQKIFQLGRLEIEILMEIDEEKESEGG